MLTWERVGGGESRSDPFRSRAYFEGLEIVCSRVNNQLRAVLRLGARGSFVSLLSSSHCSRAKARGNMDL